MTLQQIQQLQEALEIIECITGYTPKYILSILDKDNTMFSEEDREGILREVLKAGGQL